MKNWFGAFKQWFRLVYGWGHFCVIMLLVGGRFLCWRSRFRFLIDYQREGRQSDMKCRMLFVRHGQTTWNVEHRLPGQLPGVALNEHGRQQAARLAEALVALPISAIISSPLERARDTAQYLASGRDLEIQLEPDLMDTQVGPWAGRVISEVARDDPAWKEYVRNPLVAPEGVETFLQVQQRVVAAVERWRKAEIGLYPVFVAHADVIRLLVAHYSGLDILRAGSLMIDNASVSVVEVEPDQVPKVYAIGWSPRPGWLVPPIPVEKTESDVSSQDAPPAKL